MGLGGATYSCSEAFIERLRPTLEGGGFQVRNGHPPNNRKVISPDVLVVVRGKSVVTILLDRPGETVRPVHPDPQMRAKLDKIKAERTAAGLRPPDKPFDPNKPAVLEVIYPLTLVHVIREMFDRGATKRDRATPAYARPCDSRDVRSWGN